MPVQPPGPAHFCVMGGRATSSRQYCSSTARVLLNVGNGLVDNAGTGGAREEESWRRGEKEFWPGGEQLFKLSTAPRPVARSGPEEGSSFSSSSSSSATMCFAPSREVG
ncbi:unnamed protein product [Heligmosomoides polygyrus]|uniref:Uncharacterized protein n=1 Tax=Heligmosomoides polygyrus TaxID=6339 RepID=A0A183FLF2_HELPZ|nr:unnamed protein product [Heligmosomoides polygyrus]